jgi:tRNA(adenine34) deaminase
MRLKRSDANLDWPKYMSRALELAAEAEKKGDVPIGALVVDVGGHIIAEAFNERELREDPIAHAEVLALQRASQKLKTWRLQDCTLIVTLEPCIMCAGALSLSRIDRVVYGAKDPRAGAMGSIYEIHNDQRLNHRVDMISGVLEPECRELLVKFFRNKREK